MLVEKPLGTTIESCRELRDRAAAAELVVQVGNNRRFDPGIAFARKFIAEEMGQRIALKSWYYDSVYRYTMTDNLQPIPIASAKALRPEGDPKADRRRYYLLTHGSHLVDTARFLGGPIAGRACPAARAVRLRSAGSSPSISQTARSGHLDLQIPVRGDFQEGFQVFGEHGSVSGRVHLPWFHKSSDVECFSARDRQFHRVLGEDAHTYKRQIEGFAATILERHAAGRRQPRRRPGRRAGDGRDRALGRDRRDRPARGCERRCLMHLGIFAKTFPRPTLEETLDAVVAHGLTHIQFNMSCMGLPTLPDKLDEGSCVWIAQTLHERGLTMAAISGTFNMVRSQCRRGWSTTCAGSRSGRGLPVARHADHHALHRHARPARHVEVASGERAQEHVGTAGRDDARGGGDRRPA